MFNIGQGEYILSTAAIHQWMDVILHKFINAHLVLHANKRYCEPYTVWLINRLEIIRDKLWQQIYMSGMVSREASFVSCTELINVLFP